MSNFVEIDIPVPLFTYKAKKVDNGEWVTGIMVGKRWIEMENSYRYEINPATVCISTNTMSLKGTMVYTDDVYFDETDEVDNKGNVIGDRRIYFIAKWVENWAQFIWLDIDLLSEYEDAESDEERVDCLLYHNKSGVINRVDYDGFKESAGGMYYFGNLHDFPAIEDLIEKIETFESECLLNKK